ncbi:MAG: hypothetical protein U0167_09205 [bacterium]
MRPQFSGRRGAALFLFLPALALFPGCFGDSTTQPEADALSEAENGAAADVSAMAIQLDASTLQSVPGWMSQGVGTGLRSPSSTWSEPTQEWVVTASEDYSGTEATGHIETTHRIQFLHDGTPMQYPNETTNQMHVAVTASNVGSYHPTDRYSVDYDVTLTRELSCARSAEGVISLNGDGTAGGPLTYHVGNHDYPRQTTLDWSSALTFAAGSTCPAGTITGSNGRCDFQATFDGAGTVSWTVTRNSSVVRSGNEHRECTPVTR